METRQRPTNFEDFTTDDGSSRAVPLTITDQVLVRPLSEARAVGIFLSALPDNDETEPRSTQWALTLEQARWLADHLKQAVEDVEGKRQ